MITKEDYEKALAGYKVRINAPMGNYKSSFTSETVDRFPPKASAYGDGMRPYKPMVTRSKPIGGYKKMMSHKKGGY